jgi:hypothetical protein
MNNFILRNRYKITNANTNQTRLNGLFSPIPISTITIPHNILHNFRHSKNRPKINLFFTTEPNFVGRS